MRNNFVLIFIISTLIIAINSSSISHRTKRNPDGFLDKVKTGLVDFGTGTKNYFVKGYEETKNLFSADRKVGDYILNDITVRSGFNVTEDSQEDKGQQIESSTIRAKREQKEEYDEKIDEFPDDHEGEEQNKSVALQKNDEINDESTSNPINEPPVGIVILCIPPCKGDEVLVGKKCRKRVTA